MEEIRFDAGYREALLNTIKYLQDRILEEKRWQTEWHDKVEYKGYIRALDDTVKYLQWIVDSNKPQE